MFYNMQRLKNTECFWFLHLFYVLMRRKNISFTLFTNEMCSFALTAIEQSRLIKHGKLEDLPLRGKYFAKPPPFHAQFLVLHF